MVAVSSILSPRGLSRSRGNKSRDASRSPTASAVSPEKSGGGSNNNNNNKSNKSERGIAGRFSSLSPFASRTSQEDEKTPNGSPALTPVSSYTSQAWTPPVEPVKDELGAKAALLRDLVKVLDAFDAAGAALMEATEKLATAPHQAFSLLEDFSQKDADSRRTGVERSLAKRLSQFAEQIHEATPILRDMADSIKEHRKMTVEAIEAVESRDRAVAVKTKADKDVAEARSKEVSRRTIPVEQKRGRLAAKKKADDELDLRMGEAEQLVEKAMKGRWLGLSATLEKFCRFYATSFGGSQAVATDFGAAAKKLAVGWILPRSGALESIRKALGCSTACSVEYRESPEVIDVVQGKTGPSGSAK